MKDQIKKYYNELAKDYDADRFGNSYGQYIQQQEDEVLREYLNEKAIDLNLDIACGTGRFLKYANYGVDLSEEMIKISKNKYPFKKISVEDAENLPFVDSFFENAISFHLFMHLDISAMVKILSEANRVLKKGGYFVFDVPSEKRRKLVNYQSADWHGGNQINPTGLKKLIGLEWELVATHGTAFFPIHRIPGKLRTSFVAFDSLLCNSCLKEYSSHLIFVLKKR